MEKKPHTFIPYFLNSWIFIPAIAYFIKVNEYALNLPYADDYDAVLSFLNKFVTVEFREKLSLLISQHNEHRILLSRLIIVAYYKLFGVINFRHLIFIANIELVFIFIIIVSFIKKCIPKYWNIAAFVVALCLFDISNFENADFAMAGIQNYGVILLFLLALLAYSLSNKKFIILAIFFQAMVVYTSGNGIIASLMIVFFTVLIKDKLKIIISTASLLIFAPLYFLHYTKSTTSVSFNYTDGITYFLQQTGAVFNFEYSFYIGICVLIIFAAILPLTKKINIKYNTAPLVTLMLFVFASMVTVAYFRSGFKGVHFYTSRYLIYPHLLTGIMFVFAFLKLADRKIKWPITITFILIMLAVYKQNMEWGESGFNVEYTRLTNSNFVYPVQERAKIITDEACQKEIYCIEEER